MSSVSLGFAALHNRYVIDGTLATEAAMHVGSGDEGVNTDSAWMRDSQGIFIPGSSLRGVLRSVLERIVQAVCPERGCVLFIADSNPTCATASRTREQKLSDMPEADRFKEIEDNGALCDICLLFGSPLLASRLRISDARPEKTVEPQPRHGVGIDRDTETAHAKIKFDFEALERGPRFSFRMEIENARAADFALLGILLAEMQTAGIWVGGKKSRGLGHCRLADYKVSYFDGDGAFKLADYLMRRRLEDMPRKAFEDRLQSKISNYLEENRHVPATGQ
jgi:CRISPR-associated protein Csm3